MTVRELVECLQRLPEGLRVVVNGYEEGYDDLSPDQITRIRISLNTVIQRFETCYDCLWKVLRRHLIECIGIPDVPNGPNPAFRLADQNHLLPSSIDGWLAYAQKRIDTTHDYDGEKAVKCLEVVPDFIGDAKALYQTLSGDAWQ